MRLHARFDLDEVLRRIESDRMTLEMAVAPIALALANHPDLERYDLSSLRYIMWGATPVTESVADEVTRATGVRWLPAYGASELPVIACNPVDEPDRWRLDSAGLPADEVELRVVDLESRRGPAARRDRRDPGAQPVADGRLPPRGGHGERPRRRLVPHRRRRMDRARGLGPSHRSVQGDDQGERLPGRARRARGRAARPPVGARLRGLRHPRRPRGRGPRRRGPARPAPLGRHGRARRDWSRRRSRPTSTSATSSSSTTIPRLPSGKVLRRKLRDEWAPTTLAAEGATA